MEDLHHLAHLLPEMDEIYDEKLRYDRIKYDRFMLVTYILLLILTCTNASNWIESASGIKSATIESLPQLAKP